MKLPYREGTWFAVPLDGGGYALGLVARATTQGKVLLCYFFGPRRVSVPTISEVVGLGRDDALVAAQVGDLRLIEGTWPVIGELPTWNRDQWPMPVFVCRDELTQKAGRVYYSDTDPNRVLRIEPEPYESALPPDTLWGARAAEIHLTKLLP